MQFFSHLPVQLSSGPGTNFHPLPVAQSTRAARFEHFFFYLRLNRDQLADMTTFALQALREVPKDMHEAVADPRMQASLTTLRLSGIGLAARGMERRALTVKDGQGC